MAGTLIPSTPTSSSLVIPEGQYQGAHAADITVRTNGVALQVGDLYFDTALKTMKAYDGNGWISSSVGPQGIKGDSIDHTTRTAGNGAAGTTDTYTMWGDVAETINMGTFTIYNGANGAGDLVSTNNLSDVTSAATARANLNAASVDANTEVVELPAGAASSNGAAVLRADGTWHRPGTHDLVRLSPSYYPTAATTWLNVTGWTALQLSNFTYATGVFTCAVAGRYRIIYTAKPYNQTGVMVSALARIKSSTGVSIGVSSYTFLGTAGAYGALPQSEGIIDFAVSDTFSLQYYSSSIASGNCYLQNITSLIIEEL